jgi:RNA polymerase-binding transcription factor DksA
MSKLNRNSTTRSAAATPPGTPAYWTAPRLSKAEKALSGRVTALRADIARELRKYDDERLGLVADNVADSAELSIADVIGDLYLAEIDRDVRELRDVENALTRISGGTYGNCIDCAQGIDPMRLEFNPHAARCLHCQENAERALQSGRRSASL